MEGFFSNGVYNFSPSESFVLCPKGYTILDVREEYMTMFKRFDVVNVMYVPFSRLEASYGAIPSGKKLIVADSAGLKSRKAVLFLQGRGFENVYNMAGGFIEWERDGLPVSTDNEFRLSGSCMCQLKPRSSVSKSRGEGMAGKRGSGKKGSNARKTK